MGKGLKTHSGAKKRFKITKSKKVLFKKACNNHLLTNKGSNNKSNPYGKLLSKTYEKKVKTLFPYNQ
ncbi:MAG: 50S ribosomal protein L35 [candidate division SR1 bacterium]|nr:50S ribosomal protein L35 [candidate division SR1 bacterium]